jgi:hypothetical protein
MEVRNPPSSHYPNPTATLVADSPRNNALRQIIGRPLSFLAAGALALGLTCLARSADVRFRVAGFVLCICALGMWVYIYRAITHFFLNLCAVARTTDLADIPASYGTGFWVAVLESADRKQSEVVGCLGLGGHTSASLPYPS